MTNAKQSGNALTDEEVDRIAVAVAEKLKDQSGAMVGAVLDRLDKLEENQGNLAAGQANLVAGQANLTNVITKLDIRVSRVERRIAALSK